MSVNNLTISVKVNLPKSGNRLKQFPGDGLRAFCEP